MINDVGLTVQTQLCIHNQTIDVTILSVLIFLKKKLNILIGHMCKVFLDGQRHHY